MYTYVTSLLRRKNTPEAWKEVNISNMLISTIFDNYASGYIKLTNKYLSKPVYLDLQEFKAMNIATPDLTFTMWLTFMGNATFATNEVEPVYKTGVVSYCDAWQAGYSINRMNLVNTETENMVDSDLPNLHLKKIGLAAETLGDYCLTIVNGYLHFSDTYKDGMKIVDGAKTIDKTGNNQIGLLSFSNVGKIKQVKLKSSMITATNESSSLSRGLFITLGRDISNYKVMLSIGGFLHFDSNSFTVVNSEEGIIRVDIDSINIHEKLLLGMRDIDYEENKLGISENYPMSIVKEKLLSDTSLRYFFEHSTTFVILVETEVISVERSMVDNIKLFSLYEYGTRPYLPIIDYYGRLPVYHFSTQLDKYVLRMVPQYAPFHNYQSTDGNYNRINAVTAPSYYSKMVGHFLEIKGHKRA